MMHLGWSVMILACMSLAQEGEIQLDLKNKENVVASHLEGTWKINAVVNAKLQGHDLKSEIIFVYDKEAIPAETLRKLAGSAKVKFVVYAIGKMTFNEKTHPFLLLVLNGNPHVVYFRDRGGDPMGETESFNVMLAVAKDRKDDLFFMGGDFNSQPFAAFERVK